MDAARLTGSPGLSCSGQKCSTSSQIDPRFAAHNTEAGTRTLRTNPLMRRNCAQGSGVLAVFGRILAPTSPKNASLE